MMKLKGSLAVFYSIAVGVIRVNGFVFPNTIVPPVAEQVSFLPRVQTPHVKEVERVEVSSPCFSLGSLHLEVGIGKFLIPSANAADDIGVASTTQQMEPSRSPTDAEIKLLREGLSAFYNERNPYKAEPLLSRAIDIWDDTNQAVDERSALRGVRAKCYMLLLRPSDALRDYDICVGLLEGAGGELVETGDRAEAYLGRARALRSRGVVDPSSDSTDASMERQRRAVKDYEAAIRLLSREDWDTNEEREEDGATRNPFAAYEWGNAMRAVGDFEGAFRAHQLASGAFDDVADAARSVISALDAGIDLAAKADPAKVEKELVDAIGKTTSVEGRDVALLQRVIAKEGEARIALASVLWTSNERAKAEGQLGEACIRLDQLEADAIARNAKKKLPAAEIRTLGFSIDDLPGAGEVSCARFKNENFLSDTLGWPVELRQKVKKLERLGM